MGADCRSVRGSGSPLRSVDACLHISSSLVRTLRAFARPPWHAAREHTRCVGGLYLIHIQLAVCVHRHGLLRNSPQA
eukprot:2133922-Prymnesium_polylepis.1